LRFDFALAAQISGGQMSPTRPDKAPATWLVIAAFIALYLIWGSTYLAIRYAIESFPPFLMAGFRFLIAGAILFGWTRARGAAAPTRIHWRSTLIVGTLLLFGGNGGVTWAEQRVPSGIAALLVAIVPLWVVVLNWLRPGGVRPALPIIAGVLVGLFGIVLLVSPGESAQGAVIDPIGIIALLLASFSWANGTLYSRRAAMPESPLLTTGMEMLCGGAVLALVGTITGEWTDFDINHISAVSLVAIAYLVIFGAVVAFTAYVWLLRVTTPARATTYAYVNPVVAVFLGWSVAGEPLTTRTIIAAAIIILAVIIITTYRESDTVSRFSPTRLRNILRREV
jgi:drug/metabolite transporter (DMT)-like permease